MFGGRRPSTFIAPRVVHKILTQSWEKLGEDLSEDQQYILKDLIWGHPDVFTDMPRETDVIHHRVKLKDNTPIHCKPYPLPYA